MDLVDFLDFRGPVFRPVGPGSLWRPLATFSSPSKKVYGGLEAWILDAWRLGGLEAWSLVALVEAGGLEARGLEAGPVFQHARRSERSADWFQDFPFNFRKTQFGWTERENSMILSVGRLFRAWTER